MLEVCLDGEKIMFFFDLVKFSSGYYLEGQKITFFFDIVCFPMITLQGRKPLVVVTDPG